MVRPDELDTDMSIAGGLDRALERAERLGLSSVVIHPGSEVGDDRLLAFHLNDATSGLGSASIVRRTIGEGNLGLDRNLRRRRRLRRAPGASARR